MRTIIAGGREFNDTDLLDEQVFAFDQDVGITRVVSGGARGADKLGEAWAEEHGYPVTRFPAKWGEHGKSAGYIRNVEMADYADALIAFWDGESRGTKHMIDTALDKGLIVQVVRYE